MKEMSIELQDINMMVQIIHACQMRGSFKPEEMVDVGNLYNRLKALLPKETETPKPVPSQTQPVPETMLPPDAKYKLHTIKEFEEMYSN
jgi:hypothetical protein